MQILPSTFPSELLWNLTLRELRGKYKRSILGWGWSLLNPIVFLLMYSVVFMVIFRQEAPVGDPSGLKVYPFFLVAALLPWTFHSNCINGAIMSLAGNVNLIRKVWFPRYLLPASTGLSWLITFAIEMSVLSVALAVAGHGELLMWVPVVMVVMVLQFAFSIGIGLAAAALNAFFRDVEYLTGIVLQLWFWATPVVWPVTVISSSGHHPKLWGIPAIDILKLNPMYHFVEAYRDLLYEGHLPGPGRWAAMVVTALISVAIGTVVFRRVEPRMGEEL